MAEAAQVENEAEEPSPAPMGKVDRAVKLNDGLRHNEKVIIASYLNVRTFHPHAPKSYTSTRRRGRLLAP